MKQLKTQKVEKAELERELSSLLERTFQLEDELNSFVNYEN